MWETDNKEPRKVSADERRVMIVDEVNSRTSIHVADICEHFGISEVTARSDLDKLEREATGPVTLVHMSDNGEWPVYLGRSGWTVLRESSFELPGEDGDCPQHATVRRFVPKTACV